MKVSRQAVVRGIQPPWSGESSPAANAAAQRDMNEACESLIAEQTQYFAARADFVVVAELQQVVISHYDRSNYDWAGELTASNNGRC